MRQRDTSLPIYMYMEISDISEILLILNSFIFNDFIGGTKILFFLEEMTFRMKSEKYCPDGIILTLSFWTQYLKLSLSVREGVFCTGPWYLWIILISSPTVKTAPCLLSAFRH